MAGIDHCFVLKNNTEPAAILESVKNGLTMKVYTDQPAVQIYVGGKTSDELQNKESVNITQKAEFVLKLKSFRCS